MIAPHRPTFGLRTVIASLVTGGERKNVQALERAFAEQSGCPAAVWLPSARAGICWALRGSIGADTKVFGPAFTCAAVHEAIARSGGYPVVLDAAADGFLMDEKALLHSQSGKNALVLCEVYGHAYDLEQVSQSVPSRPLVRIVDMAMSVPHRRLFDRLQASDFAVISFGAGKSMYSGWGAVGIARSSALAQEVRQQRDAMLYGPSASLWCRRSAEILARTAGQHPLLYSSAGRLRLPAPSQAPAEPAADTIPAVWVEDTPMDSLWRLPSTPVDRGLALWNLKRAGRFHEIRVALARRYHDNLKSARDILRPLATDAALSHYTVRVGAARRAQAQRCLSEAGIKALTLWDFSRRLDRGEFPHASRLSSEVLNLPLSTWMTPTDVDHISEVLIRNSIPI